MTFAESIGGSIGRAGNHPGSKQYRLKRPDTLEISYYQSLQDQNDDHSEMIWMWLCWVLTIFL